MNHVDMGRELALRASLSPAQIDLLEDYQDQHGAQEDRDRQALFYLALRLGITLSGDIRTP